MTQDNTGQPYQPFPPDGGAAGPVDGPHRDPVLFPLDVHAPGTPQPVPGRPSSPAPASRQRATTTTSPRRQQTVTTPAAPGPQPAPTKRPARPKKKWRLPYFWLFVSVVFFLYVRDNGETFQRIFSQLMSVLNIQTDEQRFEAFRLEHLPATLQLDPSRRPDDYQRIIITGSTGQERRRFFIERGDSFQYVSPRRKDRQIASERIYLASFDDDTYNRYYEANPRQTVTVRYVNGDGTIKVRLSDISYYHEMQVMCIPDDLESFLNNFPRTAFVPTAFLGNLMTSGVINNPDAGLLNERGEASASEQPGFPFPGRFRKSPEEEPTRINDRTTAGPDAVRDTVAPGGANAPTPDLIEARFPGGEEGWQTHLRSHLAARIQELKRAGQSGTVTLTFEVDEQGFVSEVKALPCDPASPFVCLGPETLLATVAIEAVQRGPRWEPAMRAGRPVRFFKRLPVTLRLLD